MMAVVTKGHFWNKKRNPNWEDFKLREDASVKEEEEEEEDADDEGGDNKEEERRTKSKEESAALEVKDEPMDMGGEGKEKNVKPTEGTSGDRTSSTEKTGTSSSPDDSAIGSGSTASDSSAAQGKSREQKAVEDQDSSLMQDAATLASLSQGGRPLEEEEDEEDESGAKRRGGDSDGGLGDDEDDEEKDSENAGGKRRKIGSSPDGTARRMHSVDTTSVKFAQNSYHHVFVNKTGLCMFQRNRIARTMACHKRVTQHKYSRMSAWTHRWVTRSVTPHQREECRRWLMGQASESRRNRTSSRTINRPDRTPYRPYTRYCLDWVEDAAAPASMAVTSAGNGRSSPQVSASGISGN